MNVTEVGITSDMPGFMPGTKAPWTIAVFKAEEVPVGTRLYARGGSNPDPRLDKAEFLIDSHMNIACNGMQWLKNIRDGISTPEEAIKNMEECLKKATAEWARFNQGDYRYDT